MSKFCIITGKKSLFGNKVSYSKNISKRKFLPNLHYYRFWLSKYKKFIRLKLSTKGIRIINKIGIDIFFKKYYIKNKIKWQKVKEK